MYWNGWFPMAAGGLLLCLVTIGLYLVLIGSGRARNSALHRLDERFAHGELGDEEYKAKRETILLI